MFSIHTTHFSNPLPMNPSLPPHHNHHHNHPNPQANDVVIPFSSPHLLAMADLRKFSNEIVKEIVGLFTFPQGTRIITPFEGRELEDLLRDDQQALVSFVDLVFLTMTATETLIVCICERENLRDEWKCLEVLILEYEKKTLYKSCERANFLEH
ncbi:hypothetical protein ACJIZ3_021929 [Penstemon smallii]|uniref:Uncharacterized protein n=1 Tax=Penstemon smallii TaxID=265156 RepID=A0ABD3SN51_9LAMI